MLPWSPFWERNYFGYAMPSLQFVLSNPFVRGAVSGLGLLNLAAGIAELSSMFSTRERAVEPRPGSDRQSAYPNPDTRAEP